MQKKIQRRKIAYKSYYSIFQNHLYFLKGRRGTVRFETCLLSSRYNYLYYIMTAVPLRDAVFMVAVQWHEG